MVDYQFTVTLTGVICVEADSEKEAREKLVNNIDDFYVITDNGQQPANDSWEVDAIYDMIQEKND